MLGTSLNKDIKPSRFARHFLVAKPNNFVYFLLVFFSKLFKKHLHGGVSQFPHCVVSPILVDGDPLDQGKPIPCWGIPQILINK